MIYREANGGYFDTRKKSLETRSKTECIKIASVGLKLDKPCCTIGYCL